MPYSFNSLDVLLSTSVTPLIRGFPVKSPYAVVVVPPPPLASAFIINAADMLPSGTKTRTTLPLDTSAVAIDTFWFCPFTVTTALLPSTDLTTPVYILVFDSIPFSIIKPMDSINSCSGDFSLLSNLYFLHIDI